MKKIFILFSMFYIFPSFAEILNDFSNMCGMYHYMYAVPKSFTCLPGQFLPASGYECVSCPDGYTCVGGTYTFDSKNAQGLERGASQLSPDEHNTCAANTGHVMNGYWIANTITINWDDGTNTVQNTCVYGQSITLPPTPVRPGYVFGGWKIKNQN